ncbi:Histidine kinase [Azospirillaceae bacterium]
MGTQRRKGNAVLDIRLFRTTTFRLVLLYMSLFGASVGTILILIYGFTAGYLNRQTDKTISAEIINLTDAYRVHGLTGLMAVVSERSNVPRTDTIYMVVSPRLSYLSGNLLQWPQHFPKSGERFDFEIDRTRDEWGRRHAARAEVVQLDEGYRLLVGRDMYERVQFRDLMSAASLWALLFSLGLGVGGGLLLSRHMIKRIEVITHTTQRITTGDLQDRIPLSGSGDEFDQMASQVNQMLDQIGQLITGLRQVTEGVAHDLRTPLTRLRSRLEIALLETDSIQACHIALQDSIHDADRLLATFSALLGIAEAEASARANFTTVDLEPLVTTAIELFEPVATEKGIELTFRIEGVASVLGNPHLLSQAVVNLLDNAIKYTPPEGAVSLYVCGPPEWHAPSLIICDTGPGIPPEDRERVLQRFVRLDSARAAVGNGLGLSLVDAVARLHGATLTLGDNAPGLTVTLSFPTEHGNVGH